jgi:hypothetical protein
MAYKVYLSNTVLLIEDTTGNDEIVVLIPGKCTYYIQDEKYNFYCDIRKLKFVKGKFDTFLDDQDQPFPDEEFLNIYLNKIINALGGYTDNNPSPGSDIDNNKRLSRNTVFGDKIIAKRIPQLAAQFQYPLASGAVRPPDVGNGGEILQENTLLKIQTDAQVGSFANVQSTDTLRYIPGYECYLYVTPDFNDPVDGQTQFVGVMDEETGFGFGYNGLDFVFLYRRDGISQYFIIDLDEYEKINGYRLNPQKGNVYLLSYGFLGYAPAKLEVIPPQGGLNKLYTLEYLNEHDQTHLNQTFLPLRAEMNNNAGDKDMSLSVGSINAGIVDGGGESNYTFARSFNYRDAEVLINGNTEIVAFRGKSTFGGRTNYVDGRLFNFNVAQDLNKSSVIVLFRNPVLLNTPTWTDVNVDSVLEYSTDILIDFEASTDTFYSQALFRVDTLDKEVESFRFDLAPGDMAVFAAETTGQGEIAFSNFWKELF